MAASHDDINLPVLITLGVVTTLCVVVTVIAVQAWFSYEMDLEFKEKVVDQPYLEYQQQKYEQEANLLEWAWRDREQRIAKIPIDQAMNEIVKRYASSGTASPQP